MSPPIDRDYPVSQFFATVGGEQPVIVRSKRAPITPNEKTLPAILAQLKALTGFEPSKDPLPDATLFPDTAVPPTDAEERDPDES